PPEALYLRGIEPFLPAGFVPRTGNLLSITPRVVLTRLPGALQPRGKERPSLAGGLRRREILLQLWPAGSSGRAGSCFSYSNRRGFALPGASFSSLHHHTLGPRKNFSRFIGPRKAT